MVCFLNNCFYSQSSKHLTNQLMTSNKDVGTVVVLLWKILALWSCQITIICIANTLIPCYNYQCNNMHNENASKSCHSFYCFIIIILYTLYTITWIHVPVFFLLIDNHNIRWNTLSFQKLIINNHTLLFLVGNTSLCLCILSI